MLGIWQISLLLFIFIVLPIGVFLLDYLIDKKVGVNKALREKL